MLSSSFVDLGDVSSRDKTSRYAGYAIMRATRKGDDVKNEIFRILCKKGWVVRGKHTRNLGVAILTWPDDQTSLRVTKQHVSLPRFPKDAAPPSCGLRRTYT